MDTSREFSRLFRKLDDAVRGGDVHGITERVKHDLVDFSPSGGRLLPDSFRSSTSDGYARRLLHRDTELDYTVVVMTWGPGQGTELHDHGGIWCVECVLDGKLQVTQYDLIANDADRYRFEKRTCVRAGVGDAGCLIPPFEYHVLANPQTDSTAITLHVYGGEMETCNLYRPRNAGWWERVPKSLSYSH